MYQLSQSNKAGTVWFLFASASRKSLPIGEKWHLKNAHMKAKIIKENLQEPSERFYGKIMEVVIFE
ncbi:MAG: hypothetical protein LBG21_04510 [Campylobacteraceae bacterium]|nr:hypothetical protein [Campylobacteraceae bacterium]